MGGGTEQIVKKSAVSVEDNRYLRGVRSAMEDYGDAVKAAEAALRNKKRDERAKIEDALEARSKEDKDE